MCSQTHASRGPGKDSGPSRASWRPSGLWVPEGSQDSREVPWFPALCVPWSRETQVLSSPAGLLAASPTPTSCWCTCGWGQAWEALLASGSSEGLLEQWPEAPPAPGCPRSSGRPGQIPVHLNNQPLIWIRIWDVCFFWVRLDFVDMVPGFLNPGLARTPVALHSSEAAVVWGLCPGAWVGRCGRVGAPFHKDHRHLRGSPAQSRAGGGPAGGTASPKSRPAVTGRPLKESRLVCLS